MGLEEPPLRRKPLSVFWVRKAALQPDTMVLRSGFADAGLPGVAPVEEFDFFRHPRFVTAVVARFDVDPAPSDNRISHGERLGDCSERARLRAVAGRITASGSVHIE